MFIANRTAPARWLAPASRVAAGLCAFAFTICALFHVDSARAADVSPVQTSEQARFRVVTVAAGLEHPWSMAFLPDGRVLVTERPGRLRLVDPQGRLSQPIANVPPVLARGQGGLLDVALSPDFDRDRTLFLSYAEPTVNGGRTAVARAVLNGQALSGVKVIFRQAQDPPGANHWGSRLVFARDGNLFITLGDRYTQRDRAQDLSSHFGKIVRIAPDGSVPQDNPYKSVAGALPEIWSIGHRNVQGAALNPADGRLWTTEHGAQGGDEVNIPLPGRNYGWPIITHGIDYSGAPIGIGAEKEGLEQPVLHWTPSIAPSGLTFYDAGRFPGWHGNLFAGSLKFGMLIRLEINADKVVHQERLLKDLGHRIRDVRQGPDGYLYLLTDEAAGRLLRLEPAPP